VKLSHLLSGEAAERDLFFDVSRFSSSRTSRLVKKRVVRIVPQAKWVEAEDGTTTAYDTLVLCQGSSARLPSLPGTDLKGVYTFRELGDARKIIGHADRASHAVVIGGGYLGLETAFGLHRRDVQCAIVEFQDQLMPGHLEAAAACHLKSVLESFGIAVHTGCQVISIDGDDAQEVRTVRLGHGDVLKADMVVVCAGVVPNVELARAAGLAVGRGILVNDSMRTSDPAIYAIGECAEHRGRVYGLVGPVIEQAEIALEAIRGGKPVYKGSVAASSLKIAGVDLFTAGECAHGSDRQLTALAYRSCCGQSYRALTLRDGRIIGAVALGAWAQTYRLRRVIETGERVGSWQARRFRRTGQLWRDSEMLAATSWPAEAIVCNCRLVTKGAIENAVAAGANTAEAICRATGAAQLCGSCSPLVNQFLGQGLSQSRESALGAIGLVSLIVLAGVSALIAAPPWPISPSADEAFRLDRLWTNGVTKQVTGFSLLAVALLAGLLSLRRHGLPHLPGSYQLWRLVHAGLGIAMLALLFAHTGLRLGTHLNSWLMTSFLATVLAGAFAGIVAGLRGRMVLQRPGAYGRLRRAAAWLHILVAWPLPVLLLLHILVVYYF
jgi:nitrite reductase (NADH) large subunit